MGDKAEIGKRAYVPFRDREKIGYIVGFSKISQVKKIKNISSIIDEAPILSPQMLELAKWISETYLCSRGEAIDAMIPGILKKGKTLARTEEKNAKEIPSHLPEEPFRLNQEQVDVLKSVLEKIEKKTYRTFLLHGITASGKTEIYLQAIDKVLKNGCSSIVLVPEISLTPQTVGRFVHRFGRQVAVVHSRLVGSMRYKDGKK